MSFFGNHVNLTPASQSDWNKNNSKDVAHIKNRPFFIDDNGEIHKLNKDFLPDEVALKEDIRVTSVNGMTGDVIIEAGGGDSVIIPDGIYVQENEPMGAEDGALWVDLDEEIVAEQPGVGQFGLGENAEVFNGIDPANASGDYSHAEGYNTYAKGPASHAEGRDTWTLGYASHAEGEGTIASGNCSHVQGVGNIEDNDGRYAHIVGNGYWDDETGEPIRSNAHTLDWEGNAWFAGKVFVGGTSQDDAIELGAGNGQADWAQSDEEGQGYIKNRTHFLTTEAPLCEGTIQVREGEGGGWLDIADSSLFEIGKKYEVRVNDKPYYCECYEFEDGLILGNILLAYNIALGEESELLQNILLEFLKMIYGVDFLGVNLDAPFCLLIDDTRIALVTKEYGNISIKISPITDVVALDKSFIPDIPLPERTVYDTFYMRDYIDSVNTVQKDEGDSFYLTKLSNSSLYTTPNETLELLKNKYISYWTNDIQPLIDEPISSDAILEDTFFLDSDFSVELEGVNTIAPLGQGLLYLVMFDSVQLPGTDFILTKGLWITGDFSQGFVHKITISSGNEIISNGIIPDNIARTKDFLIQYDKFKSCGEERIYVEWSKDEIYPEGDSSTVILSKQHYSIKELCGKHYLTKHIADDGTIITTDKILTNFDFNNALIMYTIDEIQFLNEETASSLSLLLSLEMGMAGVIFPKEPEDESLIYFKIYEPAKQLDDSLLSNNIARKEDLPCHDAILYYEWNEDMEYEIFIDAPDNTRYSKMVKISDDTPDSSFFIGKQFFCNVIEGGKQSSIKLRITADDIIQMEGPYGVVEPIIIVTADSVTFEGMTLSKGIWTVADFVDPTLNAILEWRIYDPTKTIEEKYLPDTVVKSSDLQGKTLINPEIASVGQLMMVEEVDGSGAPIKWKAVDANSLLNAILPPISEEDNGKTLTVVEGTWQLI